MTTTATQTHAHTHHDDTNYLNASKGVWSWLFTLDHKRIGLMYLVGVVSSFFLGGMFALGVRTVAVFSDADRDAFLEEAYPVMQRLGYVSRAQRQVRRAA